MDKALLAKLKEGRKRKNIPFIYKEYKIRRMKDCVILKYRNKLIGYYPHIFNALNGIAVHSVDQANSMDDLKAILKELHATLKYEPIYQTVPFKSND